ncbi:class I SAM-dependent methyltransferase [Methanococcus voltae]|uniref:16S rRNA (Guanine1207-N2)-methyltransferase n=1 Tax=Methanococcus voltae TaxID=2188 RepID=A0A8J7RPL8_METVO|nr:methyltransferase [Methanococcus voltae]MBP2173010.1 16S rRNA (guanine1207-N2)-methyltransferase [Methanococcus voltae]MBP2201934.1 16S rRNA (guanine1207-N2)-methyltransferase [Methanococcus voltae]
MHYFSENPNSKHNETTIKGTINNKVLSFNTDAGIFSPNYVDKGSQILVNYSKFKKDDDILDMGCGYGAIGISLADDVNSVVMTDINKRSVSLAKQNVKLNHVKNKNITVLQGNLYEEVPKDSKFDVIISNPPIKAGKVIIHQIISEGLEYLKPNGKIYVVIKTKHGAKSLTDFMEKTYGNVEIVKIKSGYRVLCSVNNLNNKNIQDTNDNSDNTDTN